MRPRNCLGLLLSVFFAAPSVAKDLPPILKKAVKVVAQDWSAPQAFSEVRTYQYDIFRGDDRGYEIARKRDPHLNRYRSVEFSPNGRATLILTDIPSDGKYEIKGDEIHVRFEFVEGLPRRSTLVFSLSPDRKTLTGSQGEAWKLSEGR